MTIKELKDWLGQWEDDIIIPDQVVFPIIGCSVEFMEQKYLEDNVNEM